MTTPEPLQRSDFSRPAGESARQMLPPSRARRVLTPGQMARRRFAVRWTKRLLPAAALALLTMIALWPEIDNGDSGRIPFRVQQQARPEAMRVLGPRYQGVDELNRPFTVTAREAQQQGSTEVIDLQLPRADITMTDGSWIYVESREGRYDKPANHLDLHGDVTIFHDNGMMLLTQQAAVEIGAGTASGNTPVAAQGGFGTLNAEGFRLLNRGAVVIFTGHAHAVLEGNQK